MTAVHERKDFKWLVTGGFVLAAHAGFINVVCLSPPRSQAVGHTTGMMATVTLRLSEGEFFQSLYLMILVLSFMLGAFITGLITGNAKFNLDSRYGIILLCCSGLITLAATGFAFSEDKDNKWLYCLLALASGMQNAMCTTFSGAVIRTTHTTGTSTDIGILLGIWIRDNTYRKYWLGKPPKQNDQWKLKILFPLWFGYLFGGLLAGLIFKFFSYGSLYLPGATLGITGMLYIMLRCST
eukprot:TRINITY_DN3716_c0_g1_i2.p1 TRINITY_DN3716_c0_g1~~TRINITY_DN3716_c0_g1_i2.p1  ORF type:complete len:239 (-),score=44.07 TRINITY_DN3716_c0_g1_i2:254-970(-)